MSWSVTFIGKPENVSKALNAQSEQLMGFSKEEFDAALPHLDGLVKQNFNSNADNGPVIKLVASGHGQKDSYGYCVCSIESLGGVIV